MNTLQPVKDGVRSIMRRIAHILNNISRGKLHPDTVTIFGFLMHIPIAWLIASRHPLWAALLLVIFGLFDTLDGELARLQKRSSARGMLLDASTDRMKEVLLYMGIALYFNAQHPGFIIWPVAALGASLCVSYVKAKGEAAVASGASVPHDKLNRMFKDGLLTFEVRMALLVVGLLTGTLPWIVAAIAILAGYTALQRLVTISRALDS
jgi:phosphatidylglycerophosphate synthase